MATAHGRVVALECLKCPMVNRVDHSKVVQTTCEGRVGSSNDNFGQKK